MYNEKVMKHFQNPLNAGEIPDADSVGQVGNTRCGDIMWIYLKIKEDRISDIGFKTLGCAAAIATSSMATEIARGMKIHDAAKISNIAIVKSLGGLPAPKIHCSVLAADGIKEAVYDYLSKNGREIPPLLAKEHERIRGSKD